MADPAINGDLILTMVAYNAGPGSLLKWRSSYSYADPLLFLESLPNRETRNFVERVMANYLDLSAPPRPGHAQPRPGCRRRLADLSSPGWLCRRRGRHDHGGRPFNDGVPVAGRIDESRPFQPVHIAVLTVSDTRGEADDNSGRTLVELITRDGHKLVDRAIVKDDRAAITAKLRAWIADPADRGR